MKLTHSLSLIFSFNHHFSLPLKPDFLFNATTGDPPLRLQKDPHNSFIYLLCHFCCSLFHINSTSCTLSSFTIHPENPKKTIAVPSSSTTTTNTNKCNNFLFNLIFLMNLDAFFFLRTMKELNKNCLWVLHRKKCVFPNHILSLLCR